MDTPPVPVCELHGLMKTRGSYALGQKYNKTTYSKMYYCIDCLEGKEPMAKVNISDIIDVEKALIRAFSNPKLMITARKLPPTIEATMKIVLEAIEEEVQEVIAAKVQPVLADRHEGYVLFNGEHGDIDISALDDYAAGLDDVAEEICEPYEEFLSQDWLAKNTIDTAFWEEEAIDKFSQKLGKEYYKGLVHDNAERKQKTPAKILSGAGITQELVQAWLSSHIANGTTSNPQTKEEDMANTNSDLQGVLEKVAAHVGKDYDILEIIGDFDLASDDDDILANGAAPRLGLDATDIEHLRNERLLYGNDTGSFLEGELKLVLAAVKKPAGKGKAAKAAPTPAEPKAAPAAKARGKKPAEETPADDAVSLDVLVTLKECGAGDVPMATALGVSRGTYNGYATGKTEFKPTPAQADAIRTEIVNRINKLGEALKELDGTEVEFVI